MFPISAPPGITNPRLLFTALILRYHRIAVQLQHALVRWTPVYGSTTVLLFCFII